MNKHLFTPKSLGLRLLSSLALIVLVVSTLGAAPPPKDPDGMMDVIVQGRDMGRLRSVARHYAGEVTHELGIINSIAVRIPERMVEQLARHPHVFRVYENRSLELAQNSGIAFDAASTGTYVNQTTLTLSHTTGGGVNRLLLVGISLKDNRTVYSVTYGGANLTRAGTTNNGTSCQIEIWYLGSVTDLGHPHGAPP